MPNARNAESRANCHQPLPEEEKFREKPQTTVTSVIGVSVRLVCGASSTARARAASRTTFWLSNTTDEPRCARVAGRSLPNFCAEYASEREAIRMTNEPDGLKAEALPDDG